MFEKNYRVDYHADFDYGQTYHVYHWAIENRELFLDEKDYERFLNKLNIYFSEFVNIYAYCLIPNHFHLLIEVKEKENINIKDIKKASSKSGNKLIQNPDYLNDFLSNQFKRLLSGHSLYLNKKYKIRGPLFTKKFKRVLVDTLPKLMYIFCYIHHNPIHHGLTNSYSEWKYSSYLSYFDFKNSTFNRFLIELGKDKESGLKEFLRLHADFKEN